MSDALEAARAAGTSADVLELVQTQDFLSSCLKKAKFQPDLLQDTLDACDINDLTALTLGFGALTVEDASEKLFLMHDEASKVLSVCRKECLRAGVNYGDGASLGPDDLAEPEEEPEPAPSPAPASAQPPPKPSAFAPSPDAEAMPAASPEAIGTFPVRQIVSNGGSDHPDPNFLIKPPVTPNGPTSSSPAASTTSTSATGPKHGSIPRPQLSATPASVVRDKAPAAAAAAGKPPVGARSSAATPSSSHAAPKMTSKGAQTPANGVAAGGAAAKISTPASGMKTPRPNSAPLTARGPGTGLSSSARPQSALPTPAPTPLPSYAKPTAAHKSRVTKEAEDIPSTSSPAPVVFASTAKPLKRFLYMPPRAATEEKKEPKKPIFDNIRSSLLRPTAAFLAWTSGAKAKKEKEADLKSSQALLGPTTTRSGRLVPEDQQSTGSRTKSAKPTTPDAARASAEGSASATPAKPFRLASAERHKKAQEELARKIEEKSKESLYKPFKATPMPASARKSKWGTPNGAAGPAAASPEQAPVEAAAATQTE